MDPAFSRIHFFYASLLFACSSSKARLRSLRRRLLLKRMAWAEKKNNREQANDAGADQQPQGQRSLFHEGGGIADEGDVRCRNQGDPGDQFAIEVVFHSSNFIPLMDGGFQVVFWNDGLIENRILIGGEGQGDRGFRDGGQVSPISGFDWNLRDVLVLHADVALFKILESEIQKGVGIFVEAGAGSVHNHQEQFGVAVFSGCNDGVFRLGCIPGFHANGAGIFDIHALAATVIFLPGLNRSLLVVSK